MGSKLNQLLLMKYEFEFFPATLIPFGLIQFISSVTCDEIYVPE